ncbi:MAG: stage 0 sporulation family protein [Eubacterium sp.]|nr:stage 0 sporulation family protein [Eubacterium sp.]
MINVIGVKFKHAGKLYYFDPAGITAKLGEAVIVETARGVEFGTVALEETMIEKSKIVPPLKPIIRVATEEDIKINEENNSKKAEALKLCQEKVDKHNLDMKLIDVEYTFDNNKVVFYFTADGRVDFRELVKDLASVFKMRIELRQIGVRDEAKIMGGIGNCGRSLCCHKWLSEFQPVSIKMAKTQGLSLNPTKISGICGRLMCCLKYENDTYCEAKKGMPEVGEKIKTPDGMALVSEVKILENEIKARLILEENKPQDSMKLAGEVITYKKEEIKRVAKKKNNKKQDEEIPEDIKELLKD